jgi:predicted nucleic acid-binding protein
VLAVLDANVLYPFQLRNLLLHLAAVEAFEPLWSDEIMEEVRRSLLARGVLTGAQWDFLDRRMREHFAEAWGRGYRAKIQELALPDADDRHVLALAIHYEADCIVTWNTRDFPEAILKGRGIERMRPPTFLDRLWKINEDLVFEAAELHRLSLTKSALSRREYLDALRDRAQLRRLAARLERRGFLEG